MAHHRTESSSSFRFSSDQVPVYDKEDDRISSPPSTPRGNARGKRSLDVLKEQRGKQSLDVLNEQSPLLLPQRVSHDDELERRSSTPESILGFNDGEDEEETKSVWYLFLLTLSIGGLQMAWSVELSNGSPYLLSLGMSKSLLALVWIAGPLSGTLVQPYVGIRSDNCRVTWGKRKPFMLAGAAATITSLLALAWTREIVRGFLGLFGADPHSRVVHISSIVFAICFVYMLDFSINTVQAGIRAFMVDNAPTHQQEDANAWAGRLTGVGNVLGYLSGYVNLPKIFPFFGNTQFKVLCVFACIGLGSTVCISSSYIRERNPRLEGPPPTDKPGVFAFFRQVFNSIKRLPIQIRKVCEVQFFNWIGWFPFLFYITTYIGQLHVNPIFEANPDMTPSEINSAWEDATRIGTFALLIFAITSFISNIILPFLIVPTYRPPPNPFRAPSASFHSLATPRPTTPGTPGTLSASRTSFFPPTPSSTQHSRLTRLLSIFQIPGLTLRRAWLLSHLLFALCMSLTFFIRTPLAATILVGFIGLSWALSIWAPFALISAEISKRDTARRKNRRSTQDNGDAEETDQAGVILGLHNVAIAAPQIIATLVSSAIFHMAQKPRGTSGDDSVGWVLRFGGLAALVAAYMTSRIEEEGEREKTEGDIEG